MNVALFWEKFNFDEYVPMVPTSAITGDGMADLMAMMVIMSQKFLIYQLMWSPEVEATVMEVQTIINIYRRFRLIGTGWFQAACPD